MANPDSLAAEIVSLLNADGGTIYLGISDNGEISGLDGEDVRRLNLMISNVATQHIKNPVTVLQNSFSRNSASRRSGSMGIRLRRNLMTTAKIMRGILDYDNLPAAGEVKEVVIPLSRPKLGKAVGSPTLVIQG